MPVIELRQISLLPGKRDDLIDLFDAHFTDEHERCGMPIVGMFRDLGDPQRLVWVRKLSRHAEPC